MHQPNFCCPSHSPDTCPHPVLHISLSSAVRPTLQTLAPIQSSTSAYLLLSVPLSRHLPPSSPPHQPIFCCPSHSPDTCPHPVLHISLSSAVRPTLQTLAPIQSSTSAYLLLSVPLSRHLPHPVLHISLSSAVLPTLETLAPIQSSTSLFHHGLTSRILSTCIIIWSSLGNSSGSTLTEVLISTYR